MVMRWNIIVKDSKLITESNGERTERKFEKVEAGAYRHITVCFENGEDLSLDLENFVVNDNYGFSEKCKKSRTEFIECLKKNGYKVSNTSSTEKQNITCQELEEDRNISYQETDEMNKMDQEGQTNVDQEDQPDIPVRSNVKKKLKGSGVIVHVENLREPNYENRVREIDEEHVEALVKSMEYSYDEYVTLIGAVDAGTDINNLSVPGKATIEVIGGNHTRVAIKRLNDQGYTKTHVKMDAHHDLTVDEATFLGCRHNLIYETSKKMDLISGCLKSNYIYPRK